MSQANIVAAAPVAARPEGGVGRQYLVFTLNGESFAIDILQIREIIEFGELTSVPMTPPTVRGVINLRGAVVPVIDLKARFGRAKAQPGRKSCVVLVELQRDVERLTLGLLVDAVSAVVDLPAGALEPPPEFGAPVRRRFIRAMGRVGARFAIVLAPDTAFDIDEMARLCEAAVAESA